MLAAARAARAALSWRGGPSYRQVAAATRARTALVLHTTSTSTSTSCLLDLDRGKGARTAAIAVTPGTAAGGGGWPLWAGARSGGININGSVQVQVRLFSADGGAKGGRAPTPPAAAAAGAGADDAAASRGGGGGDSDAEDGADHAVRDAARPKPAVEWSRDETQEWLKTHDEGKWAKYAHKFAELDGKGMSGLSKEDFLLVVEPPYGSAIFNNWRAVVEASANALLEWDKGLVLARAELAQDLASSNPTTWLALATDVLSEQLRVDALKHKALTTIDEQWELPFVNRVDELQGAAQALLRSQQAACLSDDNTQEEKHMTLLVCGHYFGTGKSSFGRPLAAVLGRLMLVGAAAGTLPVKYLCFRNQAGYKSVGRFGELLLLRLGLPVNDGAPSLAQALLRVRLHLATTDTYLFLHLDEFIVSAMDEALFPAGATGIDRLYAIWRDLLLAIQQEPRIFLFVTGRDVNFSLIGLATKQSPTRVHQALLAPLKREHVQESLGKLRVFATPDGSEPVPLLDALELNGDADKEGFVKALVRSTAGIPRFCQLLAGHALRLRLAGDPTSALELVSPGGAAFTEMEYNSNVTRAADDVKQQLSSCPGDKHRLIWRYFRLLSLTAPGAPTIRVQGTHLHKARLGAVRADVNQVFRDAAQFGFHYDAQWDDSGGGVATVRFLAPLVARKAFHEVWGEFAPTGWRNYSLDWADAEKRVLYALAFGEMGTEAVGADDVRVLPSLSPLRDMLGVAAPAKRVVADATEPEAPAQQALGLVEDLPKVSTSGRRKDDEGAPLSFASVGRAYAAGKIAGQAYTPTDMGRLVLPAALARAPTASWRVFKSGDKSAGPDGWVMLDGGKVLVGVAIKHVEEGSGSHPAAASLLDEARKFDAILKCLPGDPLFGRHARYCNADRALLGQPLGEGEGVETAEDRAVVLEKPPLPVEVADGGEGATWPSDGTAHLLLVVTGSGAREFGTGTASAETVKQFQEIRDCGRFSVTVATDDQVKQILWRAPPAACTAGSPEEALAGGD